MSNRKAPKLTLNKLTLRHLSPRQAGEVAGGVPITQSLLCISKEPKYCPTEQGDSCVYTCQPSQKALCTVACF